MAVQGMFKGIMKRKNGGQQTKKPQLFEMDKTRGVQNFDGDIKTMRKKVHP